MTHDDITRHGANIIDLMMGYAEKNGMSTYELFLVIVEVIKLMKKMVEEQIKKSDS